MNIDRINPLYASQGSLMAKNNKHKYDKERNAERIRKHLKYGYAVKHAVDGRLSICALIAADI